MLSCGWIVLNFFVLILRVSSITLPFGTCKFCIRIDLEKDIQFHLYTRSNPTTPHYLKFENDFDLENSPFHPEHHTIIYIHGYTESAMDNSSRAIVDAYLRHNQYNVVLVNWKILAAGPNYFNAVSNVKIIGARIAQFINWLEDQNQIHLLNVHIIGFSLGAHAAGYVGKKLAPKIVGRITGLDPAAPLFEKKSSKYRLSMSDAIFVDIIHTNGRLWGMVKPIGHIDFYPNQGLLQPNCESETNEWKTCSHSRAWQYYAESVSNPHGFPASECEKLEPGWQNCTQNADNFMGFGVNRNIRGIFYLKTNSEPPYATKPHKFTDIEESPTEEYYLDSC